jgi:hypothetical protein
MYLIIWMNKREWVLVAEQAVDGEAGLVANAEPSFAEDIQGLGLGRKQDLPKSLVPRFQAGDLVYDDL